MSKPVNDEIEVRTELLNLIPQTYCSDGCDGNGSAIGCNSPDDCFQIQCEYCYTVRFPLVDTLIAQTKKAELKGRIDGLNHAIKTSNHRDFVPVWMINELINQSQSERNKLEGK
jgi:hypothetical protein